MLPKCEDEQKELRTKSPVQMSRALFNNVSLRRSDFRPLAAYLCRDVCPGSSKRMLPNDDMFPMALNYLFFRVRVPLRWVEDRTFYFNSTFVLVLLFQNSYSFRKSCYHQMQKTYRIPTGCKSFIDFILPISSPYGTFSQTHNRDNPCCVTSGTLYW